MAKYPALSFPKHNTPSPQQWKGLHLHQNGNPALTTLLTKGIQPNRRNHNSRSTSPIPLPQTTAITCLSDPAPKNQLATLSQDQQAKRARQRQDTLPGTRKRTRSQTKSQQHTPLTQIIDTVALSSQIVIQPTENPANSQSNKRTTRLQITSHKPPCNTSAHTNNHSSHPAYQFHQPDNLQGTQQPNLWDCRPPSTIITAQTPKEKKM